MARLSIAPDSELSLLLKRAQVAGDALVVDTGDAVYRLRIWPAAEDPRMQSALDV